MNKKSITIDELVTCLSAMNRNTSFGEVLRLIDPSVTDEDLHYYQHRLHFYYKRAVEEKVTMPHAAALMLKEEKVDRVAIALAMFGYCNYYLGGKHSDAVRERKDDIIAQALDKLAEDLGGRADVIKINFENNGKNKPSRPANGEHDNGANTTEGEGD